MKFSELNLHPQLKANLEKINFEQCTPIQEQAIPIARSGKDVAGLAQTGTGKTGAFIIPILDRMLWSRETAPPVEGETGSLTGSLTVPFTEWKKRQFILILVPTRELAEQVQETTEKFIAGTGFSSVSIYGGTSYDKQIAALKEGCEFVIATPGRLIDLYKDHLADLGQVRAVIFDEADRMFDMGFKDDMKFILRRLPRERQFLVFSATLNFDVLNVAYEFGADPVEVNISRDQAKADHVKDFIFHVGHTDKPAYLLSVLKKHNPKQTIIFSNFKRNVERIARFLTKNNVPAVGISSLLTQGQRTRVMEQFKAANDRNILVATDLAARGLDILGVDLVINFELPDDPENYVHRIGRTGRAGAEGTAYSFVCDRDVDALSRIETYLKHKVEAQWLDEEEIVKEFSHFPSAEEVEGRSPSRPAQNDRGRSDRGDRGGRGAGGGGGGPRDRGGNQERRPQQGRGPRPQQNRGGPSNGPARAPVHESQRNGDGRHRDKQSGRHRNDSGRAPVHESQRTGGRAPVHESQRNAKSGTGSSGRNNFQHHRKNYRGASAPKKAPPPAASNLTKKVSGFFKKLFGAE